MHQRLSNLSSQHQYDAEEGIAINKSPTMQKEQPVDLQ